MSTNRHRRVSSIETHFMTIYSVLRAELNGILKLASDTWFEIDNAQNDHMSFHGKLTIHMWNNIITRWDIVDTKIVQFIQTNAPTNLKLILNQERDNLGSILERLEESVWLLSQNKSQPEIDFLPIETVIKSNPTIHGSSTTKKEHSKFDVKIGRDQHQQGQLTFPGADRSKEIKKLKAKLATMQGSNKINKRNVPSHQSGRVNTEIKHDIGCEGVRGNENRNYTPEVQCVKIKGVTKTTGDHCVSDKNNSKDSDILYDKYSQEIKCEIAQEKQLHQSVVVNSTHTNKLKMNSSSFMNAEVPSPGNTEVQRIVNSEVPEKMNFDIDNAPRNEDTQINLLYLGINASKTISESSANTTTPVIDIEVSESVELQSSKSNYLGQNLVQAKLEKRQSKIGLSDVRIDQHQFSAMKSEVHSDKNSADQNVTNCQIQSRETCQQVQHGSMNSQVHISVELDCEVQHTTNCEVLNVMNSEVHYEVNSEVQNERKSKISIEDSSEMNGRIFDKIVSQKSVQIASAQLTSAEACYVANRPQSIVNDHVEKNNAVNSEVPENVNCNVPLKINCEITNELYSEVRDKINSDDITNACSEAPTLMNSVAIVKMNSQVIKNLEIPGKTDAHWEGELPVAVRLTNGVLTSAEIRSVKNRPESALIHCDESLIVYKNSENVINSKTNIRSSDNLNSRVFVKCSNYLSNRQDRKFVTCNLLAIRKVESNECIKVDDIRRNLSPKLKLVYCVNELSNIYCLENSDTKIVIENCNYDLLKKEGNSKIRILSKNSSEVRFKTSQCKKLNVTKLCQTSNGSNTKHSNVKCNRYPNVTVKNEKASIKSQTKATRLMFGDVPIKSQNKRLRALAQYERG